MNEEARMWKTAANAEKLHNADADAIGLENERLRAVADAAREHVAASLRKENLMSFARLQMALDALDEGGSRMSDQGQMTIDGVVDLLGGSSEQHHQDLARFFRELADRVNTSDAKTYTDREEHDVSGAFLEMSAPLYDADLLPPDKTLKEAALDTAVACFLLYMTV